MPENENPQGPTAEQTAAALKVETDAAAKVQADADAKAKAEADAAAIDPKKPSTHPPVTAVGGTPCRVEGCGWIFGDPVHGIEPHPTAIITMKPPPKVEPVRPMPPPRPASTAKCEPVGAMNECPTCHWSAATSAEPHPVL